MRLSALSLRLAGAAVLFAATAAAATPAAATDPVRAPSGNSATTDTGGSPEATPAAPRAAAKEEHKICRFDAASGSNLRGKKICLTAAQWRDRQD
jgi:long-subunit fatty acid transport protein